MVCRGGIWWIHPRSVQRTYAEPPAGPPHPPERATITLDGPRLLDRGNAVYRLAGDLEITRPLGMMPRGLKDVVIDGQGHAVRGAGLVLFGDDAENLTIENMVFKGADRGRITLLLTNCRKLTIRKCTFEKPAGIVTTGISTADVTVEDCRFAAAGAREAILAGHGRHVIRRCRFEDKSGTVIHLTLADGSAIEGNTLAGGKILIELSRDVRVAGNNLGAPALVDLDLKDCPAATVQGNQFAAP
jgi:hypothetical protein